MRVDVDARRERARGLKLTALPELYPRRHQPAREVVQLAAADDPDQRRLVDDGADAQGFGLGLGLADRRRAEAAQPGRVELAVRQLVEGRAPELDAEQPRAQRNDLRAAALEVHAARLRRRPLDLDAQ